MGASPYRAVFGPMLGAGWVAARPHMQCAWVAVPPLRFPSPAACCSQHARQARAQHAITETCRLQPPGSPPTSRYGRSLSTRTGAASSAAATTSWSPSTASHRWSNVLAPARLAEGRGHAVTPCGELRVQRTPSCNCNARLTCSSPRAARATLHSRARGAMNTHTRQIKGGQSACQPIALIQLRVCAGPNDDIPARWSPATGPSHARRSSSPAAMASKRIMKGAAARTDAPATGAARWLPPRSAAATSAAGLLPRQLHGYSRALGLGDAPQLGAAKPCMAGARDAARSAAPACMRGALRVTHSHQGTRAQALRSTPVP